MKANLKLIDLLPDAQNLPPKVLVAGEVLLYHIADSVYREAVIGVFETIRTDGIGELHFLSTPGYIRVKILYRVVAWIGVLTYRGLVLGLTYCT